jgi:predicted metal-dependent hydrolase
MRKASLDLQLDLPLAAATPGDQLALPLLDSPMPYRLRRSARSTIRVTLEDGVLEVSAPRGTQLRAIEAAVRDRGAMAAHAPVHLPRLPRHWCESAVVPFLGGQLTLHLAGSAESQFTGTSLELALPPNASPMQIRDSVHGWLQKQAHQVIEELVATRVQFPRWTLTFSRNGLATLDAEGCARLNWRLVLLSRETIAQVLDQTCARDHETIVQTDLLSE